MTWLSDMPGMGAAEDRAAKAMRFPMGAASPLWLAFSVAATAGVAYWWLTRFAKPLNIEAMAPKPLPKAVTAAPAPVEAVEAPAAVMGEAPAPAEPVAAAAEPAPVAAEVIAESAPEPELEVAPEPAPEAELEAAPAPATPDDLTRIVGIGPKLAASLAERGVTRFAQLAAWTQADLDAADAALNLKGRAVRDAWVAQARRFAEA
ncbi:MAG TPA: hypothetical protein VG939_17130 [Caulobacteraceae bacterium]|nr:hypothetical protein [Caulobacteraceae bacterium]